MRGTYSTWGVDHIYAALRAFDATRLQARSNADYKSVRLPFLYMGDGLVHDLLGLYGTQSWFLNSFAVWVPVDAITDCGILALLHIDPRAPSEPTQWDSGVLVPDTMSTCMRCISKSGEGLAYRQAQKERMIGRAYGRMA